MFGMVGYGKIIASLATIKADTANHQEKLKDFKDVFDKHIDKEEKEAIETKKEIQLIKDCVTNFTCPNHADIKKIERRFFDGQKVSENRRTTDIEERAKEKVVEAKEKAIEVKARTDKDEEIIKSISSLKTSRKYQWLTQSGIYIVLAVILKKIFTS